MLLKSKNAISRWCLLFEFLAVYAVSATISVPLDNITIGILIALILYEYYKNRTEKIILPDKMFNICYWSFFVLIIVAALLAGYQDSMKDTMKLVRFSILAFGTFYFAMQRQYHEHAVISGIALGLLTICAYSLQQFLTLPLGSRISANFAQPNNGCMVMILSIPFVVLYATWKSKAIGIRFLAGVTAIAASIAVALTGSRGGIMGLCLGGLIFLLVHTLYIRRIPWRKLLTGYATFLLMVLCIGTTYYMNFCHSHTEVRPTVQQQNVTQQNQPTEDIRINSVGEQVSVNRSYDNERLLMWKSSYHMWQDHKLYGVGLWHWNEPYREHYMLPGAKEPQLSFPHSIFVSFFAMTGLLGGIGYVLFSIGMFIYLCRQLKQNPNDIFLNALIWSLLAVTLHGAVDVGILYRHAMILYSAYLGIGVGSIAYHKRMQNKKF